MRGYLAFIVTVLICNPMAADIVYEESDSIVAAYLEIWDTNQSPSVDYADDYEADYLEGPFAGGGLGQLLSLDLDTGPQEAHGITYLARGTSYGVATAYSSLIQLGMPGYMSYGGPDAYSTVNTRILNQGPPIEITVLGSTGASAGFEYLQHFNVMKNWKTVPGNAPTIELETGDFVTIHLHTRLCFSDICFDSPEHNPERAFSIDARAMAVWYVGPVKGRDPDNPLEYDDGTDPIVPPDHIAGINSFYVSIPVTDYYGYTDFVYAGPAEPAGEGGDQVTGYRFGAAGSNFSEIIIHEPLANGQSVLDIEFGPQGEYRRQIVVGEPFKFTDVIPEGIDYFHLTGIDPGGPSVAEAPFPPVLGMKFTDEAPVKVGHGSLLQRTFSPPGLELEQVGGIEFRFPAANPGGQVSVLRQGDEGFPGEDLDLAEANLQLAAMDGVPLYYDLVADDLGFAGGIEITIHYDEAALAGLGLEESALRMWHLHEGALEDITTNLDTDANLITGYTASLSGFAVGVSIIPEPAGLVLLVVGALMLVARRRH